MSDYEPEWAKFSEVRESDIKQKAFFDKIKELRKKGVMCACGNDEATPEEMCTKCFLYMNPDNINWIWSYPRHRGDRWICYKPSFLRKMLSYKNSDNSMGGCLFMTLNRGNIWELMRWYTWEKQNHKCADCEEEVSKQQCELHHINPKIHGGREEEDNLQMLCKYCHRNKMIEIYQ